MGTREKRLDQEDCRRVKKIRTDPMLFGFPYNLAPIRIQSENDILLLFTRDFDHGCALLKDSWDCDVRYGCAMRHRNVMGIVITSNGGQGRQ